MNRKRITRKRAQPANPSGKSLEAVRGKETWLDDSAKRALVTMLLICIGIRLLLGLNSVPMLYPDTHSYEALARDIWKLDFRDYNGWRTPVYSLLLLAGGLDWSAVRVIQSLLGVGTASILFLIVYRGTRSSPLAFLAGLVYGLDLRQIVYESSILSETFSTFLLMASVLAFARIVLGRKSGRGDYLAFGVLAGFASLSRPMYAFAVLLYLGFLAVTHDGPADVHERAKKLALFASPAFAILLGWCLFNQLALGYFGLSTEVGFSLSNHSGAFIELAPPEYAKIRDAYLKARALQVARTGSYADTIFFWSEPQGYSQLGLARALTRMSLELFIEHPVLYAKGVARAWWLFWSGVPAERPYNFSSDDFASWIWAIWHLEQPFLLYVNLAFLAFAALLIGEFVRDRRAPTFDFCMAAIVLGASVVQAMIEYGENARYSSPTFPLVVYVVLVSGWRYYRTYAHRVAIYRFSGRVPGRAVVAAVSLALICVVVARRSFEQTSVERATKSAGRWLKLVDSGRNEDSWNELSSSTKRLVSLRGWELGNKGMRKFLGSAVSTRHFLRASYDVDPPMVQPGHYVVVEYKVSLRDYSSLVEVVGMTLDRDGQWHPAGYYITHPGNYNYGGTCRCSLASAGTSDIGAASAAAASR